jgi:hypothetical protein
MPVLWEKMKSFELLFVPKGCPSWYKLRGCLVFFFVNVHCVSHNG